MAMYSGHHGCAASFCNNNRYNVKKRGAHILFHTFPKEDEYCKQWIEFCKKPGVWKPTPRSAVCSAHFKKEDYQLYNAPMMNSRSELKRLNPTAVPTVFKCRVVTRSDRERMDAELRNQRLQELYPEDDRYYDKDASNLTELEIEFVDTKTFEQDVKMKELEAQLHDALKELEKMKQLREANYVLQARLGEVVKEKKTIEKENKALRKELQKLNSDSIWEFEDFSDLSE